MSLSDSVVRKVKSWLFTDHLAPYFPCLGSSEEVQSVAPDDATSYLIYASAELCNSRDRAFQESSQRVARSGLPISESSAARQTAFLSSIGGDTVAGALDLVFCFCGCSGVGR